MDYRLAPEHPFPAALEDSMAVYQWLISREGGKCLPSEVAIAGDSAGGGLTMATLLQIKNLGLPQPACAVGLSPWVDLTLSSASWEENAQFDYLPKPGAVKFVQAYAQAEDPRNPLISPLFGDFKGLPPVLIQVGDAEALRDEGIALAEKVCLESLFLFFAGELIHVSAIDERGWSGDIAGGL